jgi:hypothetical protein
MTVTNHEDVAPPLSLFYTMPVYMFSSLDVSFLPYCKSLYAGYKDLRGYGYNREF